MKQRTIMTPGAAETEVLNRNLAAVHLLIMRIQPDGIKSQSCRAPHCMGKRGWNEMILTKLPDGTEQYSLGVCCGRIGPTAFEEVSALVKAMNGKIDAATTASLRSAEVSEAVFSRLMGERIRRAWATFRKFGNRVEPRP